MALPEQITRKNKIKLGQKVQTGWAISTATLDSGNVSEIITLHFPAEIVSFQGSGNLVGTVEFSLDGVNWKNSTAIGGSNGVVSFSTYLVLAMKVSWTSGTGKLSIAAK